jgi:hypothetical protein
MENKGGVEYHAESKTVDWTTLGIVLTIGKDSASIINHHKESEEKPYSSFVGGTRNGCASVLNTSSSYKRAASANDDVESVLTLIETETRGVIERQISA